MTPVLSATSDLARWLSRLGTKGYAIPKDPRDIFKPMPGWKGPGTPPTRYKAEDSDTAFLTDEVLAYLSVQADRPWFIHLSYLQPHPPLIAPEPYNTAYDPAAVPAPVRAPSIDEEGAQHPWLAYRLRKQFERGKIDHVRQLSLLSEEDHPRLRATYYGLISAVDAQVGRLIEQLKASGAYDNTLIIFTSDHGDQLGDHWLYGKEGYFDEAFHIPLIVRDPSAEADSSRGAVVEQFTENVDVMPTILSWLGLDILRQCDGHSILPWLRGAVPADWRSEVHWEFDFRDVDAEASLGLQMDQCTLNVIRDRRYKYVHFTGLPPLLFDLQEDPHAFRNLAGDTAHAPRALEYAQKMLSWRMNHDERTLTGIKLGPEGAVSR